MKHLGDISKINGAEIEPVDIITFGSPCQDLSVAGKRAGLDGARSGLFMEAVRIIKEMREATDGKYPRFALWENVPGAFSSNKGEDFRVVLEELIKIAEPSATMPEVPPFGWAYADSYVGDGWSLAYRVFDTQYWPRTPQRRRRIYLVADFGGQSAREVLFERKGLRGHLTESPAPRERVTAYVEVGPGAADESVEFPRSAAESEIAATLYAAYGTKWNGNAGAYNGENFVLETEAETVVYESHPQDSRVKECEGVSPTVAAKYAKGTADTPLVCVATQQGGAEISENGICPTVTAAAGMSGNNQPWVVYSGENRANPQPGDPCHSLSTDSRTHVIGCIDCDKIGKAERTGGSGLGIREGDKMYTLTAKDAGTHAVAYAIDQQGGKGGANYAEEVMPTLCSDSHGTPHAVAYGISSYASNAMLSDNPHSGIYEADTSRTLDLNGGNPACNQGGIAIVESVGIDTYNGAVTGEKAATLGVNCGVSTGRNGVIQTHLVDSIGGQAERGWEGDIAPTLKASHYKFPPVVSHASGFCPEQSAKTRGIGWEEEKAPTLRSGVTPAIVSKTWDARGNGDGDTASTITGDHENRVTDYTSVVVEPTAQLSSGREVAGCLMASGYDKLGAQEMFSGDYTVIETHPAEAITVHGEEISGTLLSRDYKGAGRWDSLDKVVCCPDEEDPIALDRAFYNQGQNAQYSPQYYTDGTVPTLVAKGPAAVCEKYIVRRLTPTECARLQGFPDTWGHPDQKDSLSDEEYLFWQEVRNTHAAINGKAVKDYSKAQMEKWYNKLHSDSAEYKMWGNGIALPPSLYCMQGIEVALNNKEINEEEQ